MNSLPTIPTPAAQRWRDFRLQGVPVIVFLVALGTAIGLWNKHAGVPLLVGEAETIRSDVTTTLGGTLTELRVARFQSVLGGDPIAVVMGTDPDMLKAQLAVIEADLKLMRARMALDMERNVQNYEQIRIDLMTRRIELATAKVNLQQAESEFQRVSKLYREQIVPPGVVPGGITGYEVALRDRDALQNEVKEKTALVADLETTLARLRESFPRLSASAAEEPVNAAIAAQEQQLRLMENPVTLKAPISGMVTAILHQQGERIVAGTPIATISAIQSDHIVGYVRQPLPIEPKVGMSVQIRTRGYVSRVANEKILQVGADMQLVTAPLRIRGFDPALERGLPILIKMPESLKAHVHPGELVDLRIQPN